MALTYLVIVVFIWKLSFIAVGQGGGTSNVKIVEAPVVSRAYVSSWNQPKKLTLRISPANFTGPPALRSYDGRCFSMIEKDYKYEFCPFQNVTQHEQSTRWNSYKGVLGVFQGWEIVNGSLNAMVFVEGDSCGSTHRQCKVMFKCSLEEKLTSASEPSTCHYELVFSTPTACNSSLFAVYYLLNSTLQAKWREVQELFYHEEITFKGVIKRMDDIHRAANLTPNYVLPAEEEKKELKSSASFYNSGSKFTSVFICEKAHDELATRVKQLEAELKELHFKYNITSNSTLNVTSSHGNGTLTGSHGNSTYPGSHGNRTHPNIANIQALVTSNSTVASAHRGKNNSKRSDSIRLALSVKDSPVRVHKLATDSQKLATRHKENRQHVQHQSDSEHEGVQVDTTNPSAHSSKQKATERKKQLVNKQGAGERNELRLTQHHRPNLKEEMHHSRGKHQHQKSDRSAAETRSKGKHERALPKRVARSPRQENRRGFGRDAKKRHGRPSRTDRH